MELERIKRMEEENTVQGETVEMGLTQEKIEEYYNTEQSQEESCKYVHYFNDSVEYGINEIYTGLFLKLSL